MISAVTDQRQALMAMAEGAQWFFSGWAFRDDRPIISGLRGEYPSRGVGFQAGPKGGSFVQFGFGLRHLNR